MCCLLIQVCWERKWRAKYRNTYRFCVLPYVSALRVALARTSLNEGASNTDSQPDPTETEFWMARKTLILWLFSLHSTFRSMIQAKSGSQKREREVTKRRQRPSGRMNALRHVWRRCREFIQINDSRPYTEGIKGLRARIIFFMHEKWREQPRICTH
jgi:hypothetical protein